MADEKEESGREATKKKRAKKPCVLCVDDEPYILEGMQLNLRRNYRVSIANGGKEALKLIDRSTEPFAIIISDMRMPEMDGATFLALSQKTSPNSTRILLTGHADLQAAIKAVNEGGIFAYLSKPCPANELLTTVEQAFEQYQLVSAERETIEETLWASVSMLTEVLGLVNEQAFGRTEEVRSVVLHLAQKLGLPNVYEFEIAAMLSQIGCVTLPTELLGRIDTRQELTQKERKLFLEHPKVAQKLIERIPRLEDIAVMVGNQLRAYGTTPPDSIIHQENRRLTGANLLRISIDLCRLTASGLNREDSLDAMQVRAGNYDPRMLQVLSQIRLKRPDFVAKALTTEELDETMVADQDIMTTTGLLVIRKGREFNQVVLERLLQFHKGVGLAEPIRVLVRH